MAALGPVLTVVSTGVWVPPPPASLCLPDRTMASTTIAPTSTTSTALAAISTPNSGRRWLGGAGGGSPGCRRPAGRRRGTGPRWSGRARLHNLTSTSRPSIVPCDDSEPCPAGPPAKAADLALRSGRSDPVLLSPPQGAPPGVRPLGARRGRAG